MESSLPMFLTIVFFFDRVRNIIISELRKKISSLSFAKRTVSSELFIHRN